MKELTYQEFMELAMQNYHRGGDGYVECWDEQTFKEYSSLFGKITRSRALRMFKDSLEVQVDQAGW